MNIHQLSLHLISTSNLLNKEESQLKLSSDVNSHVVRHLGVLSTNLELMAILITDPNSKNAIEQCIGLLQTTSQELSKERELLSKNLISSDAKNICYQDVLKTIEELIESYRTMMSSDFKAKQSSKSMEELKRFKLHSDAFFAGTNKSSIDNSENTLTENGSIKNILESPFSK